MVRGLGLVFVMACGSSSPVTVDGPASQDGPAVDGPSACAKQDQALQASLDGARTTTGAMLTVHTDACGTHEYVSGAVAIDSLWRAGSITKNFVAATVLSLIHDGTIHLDDPMSTWVAMPNTAGVTVKMLLDHRSGIFNFTEDLPFGADVAANPAVDRTPQSLLDVASSHSPYFAPDAGFHYSSTNYIVLALIVEAVTTMKIGAVIHAHALAPAHLTSTFFDGEDTLDLPRVASGFRGTENVTFKYSPSIAWSAGAIVASGTDLANWLVALYGTTTVIDSAPMIHPESDLGMGTKYGLGDYLIDAWSPTSGPAEGHGGNYYGYVVLAFYFPASRTAIVAATDQDGVDPGAIVDAALGVLAP